MSCFPIFIRKTILTTLTNPVFPTAFTASLFWQISAAISEMSEANKDLLEKYRKEVALRRKYHEQLVELKGMQREKRSSSVQKIKFYVVNRDLCFQATSACCVV